MEVDLRIPASVNPEMLSNEARVLISTGTDNDIEQGARIVQLGDQSIAGLRKVYVGVEDAEASIAQQRRIDGAAEHFYGEHGVKLVEAAGKAYGKAEKKAADNREKIEQIRETLRS